MKKSSCKDQVEILDQKYSIPTLMKSEMRIRFQNAFFPSFADLPKQFFEIGEYVASVNPIGKGLDLAFFVEQLNLSEKLRLQSFPTYSRAFDTLIQLDSYGDLKIEKAALYLDQFISDIYH